jgi:DNA repair exonuclease SbcCD ATPase subunit
VTYKLTKVNVKNFKLFDKNEFVVNLDSELVVFDGPNGYGKTSIFDAIELALTGNIRRLVSVENRQVPTDIVVAHNNSKDVVASCTLKEVVTGKVVTISRELNNTYSAQSRKISNFMKLWNCYLTEDGVKKEITQIELERYLNAMNLSHNYNLFHYVEQEDTFHFLKSNNEVDRAKALSHLLGETSKLEDEIARFSILEGRLKAIRKTSVDRLKLLSPETKLSEKNKDSTSEIIYKKLIFWNESPYVWDQEDLLSITENERKQHLTAVYSIGKLVKHKEVFIKNRAFQEAIKEGKILNYYLKHFNQLDDYQQIHNSFTLSNSLSRCLKIIHKGELKEIKEELEQNDILTKIQYGDTAKKQLLQSINLLINSEDKSNNLDKLFGNIVKYRETLITATSNLTEEEASCLLCGSSFVSNKALLDAFLNKESKILAQLTEDGGKAKKALDTFKSNHLIPLAEIISEKIPNMLYPPEFIKSLEDAFNLKTRIENFHKWLVHNTVDVTNLVSVANEDLNNSVHQNLPLLKDMILTKRQPLSSEYIKDNEFYDFEATYLSVFSKSKSNLLSLDINEVNNKRIYIESCFQKSQNSRYIEIQKLNKNIPVLTNTLDKIKDIKSVYTQEIGKYRKKLIKDIEIPFYIYSGKILQSHQLGQGAGVFIKDKTGGNELKNIKLVSDWNSDHDVLNMMSSGQISAIVIALLLSLNKVYLNGINTLLIDDPVQSMDEINMISLLELLRNDFGNLQLIISTHEPDVAKYFLYKYLKFNKSVAQINLMKRTECLLPYSRNQSTEN